MKKLLFVGLFAGFGLAASAQSLDKVASIAADKICACINHRLEALDTDVLNVFKDLATMDEKEADAYVQGLEPDLQERLVAQMGELAEIESDPELNQCLEKMATDLEQYDKVLEDPANASAFESKIIEKLKKNSDCELTYLFYSLSANAEKK